VVRWDSLFFHLFLRGFVEQCPTSNSDAATRGDCFDCNRFDQLTEGEWPFDVVFRTHMEFRAASRFPSSGRYCRRQVFTQKQT
jgi:hypothetical protein